jgi:hypothetical protein
MSTDNHKTLAEMAEEAERGNHGFSCPVCHKQAFRVYYTRPRHDMILRRRLCLCCGYKITTTERPR